MNKNVNFKKDDKRCKFKKEKDNRNKWKDKESCMSLSLWEERILMWRINSLIKRKVNFRFEAIDKTIKININIYDDSLYLRMQKMIYLLYWIKEY